MIQDINKVPRCAVVVPRIRIVLLDINEVYETSHIVHALLYDATTRECL